MRRGQPQTSSARSGQRDLQTWTPSTAPSPRSSATSEPDQDAATAPPPMAPARGRSRSGSASPAPAPSAAVTPTAGSAAPRTTSSSTTARDHERETIRALLAIPRPRTRGDCLTMPRPCPWVGCRHHLLLDVARPLTHYPRRSPGVVLSRERRTPGRRAHLVWADDVLEMEAWTDDALSTLCSMADTCSLDVAARGPQRPSLVQAQLGLAARQSLRLETRRALCSLGPEAARAMLEVATLVRLGMVDPGV